MTCLLMLHVTVSILFLFLQSTNSHMHIIGYIQIPYVTVADNVVLLTHPQLEMQFMLGCSHTCAGGNTYGTHPQGGQSSGLPDWVHILHEPVIGHHR